MCEEKVEKEMKTQNLENLLTTNERNKTKTRRMFEPKSRENT